MAKFIKIILIPLLISISICLFFPILYKATLVLKIENLIKYLECTQEFDYRRLYFVCIIVGLVYFIYINNIEVLDKFRYLIACAILILLIMGKFSGSSVSAFDSMLWNNTEDYSNPVVLGHPQGIRADEWAIEKPYYFAQVKANFPYYNDNLFLNGSDMLVMAFSPVKDILILCRPSLIGFLILPYEYAFSFYWNSRLILLFLSTYELIRMLSGRKSKIAILIAFFLSFSMPIQWLLSQVIVEVVTAGQFAVVLFSKILSDNESLNKLFYSVLLGLACCMFFFSLYPAYMVPFAYIYIGMVLFLLFDASNYRKIKKNLPFFFVSISIICFMVARFFIKSSTGMNTIMNTVYPGSQRNWGTHPLDYPIYSFCGGLTAIYKDVSYLNNCEIAQFISFAPFLLYLLILFTTKYKNRIKRDKIRLIFVILGISILLFILCCFRNENIISKCLMLGVSYPRRIFPAVGYGFFLSLWLYVEEILNSSDISIMENKNSYKKAILAIICLFVFFVSAYSNVIRDYFHISESIIGTFVFLGLFLVYGVMGCWLVSAKRKYIHYFVSIYTAITIVAGGFVNPVISGVDSLFEKESLKCVRNLADHDSDARWMTCGNAGIGNLVSAQGVKRVSGYYYYPDIEMMKIIDPAEKYINIWNSFSAIDMRLTLGENYVESLDEAVSYIVWINYDTAKKLNIKYLYSYHYKIPDAIFAKIPLDLLYEDEIDNVNIYEIK